MIQFKRITYEDTKPFLLKKHYAHRMPSISFAFGLYKDDELHGVLTFWHHQWIVSTHGK